MGPIITIGPPLVEATVINAPAPATYTSFGNTVATAQSSASITPAVSDDKKKVTINQATFAVTTATYPYSSVAFAWTGTDPVVLAPLDEALEFMLRIDLIGDYGANPEAGLFLQAYSEAPSRYA